MANPLRILVVDDEPLAIERMQILLSRMDDVDLAGTAGDGEAALRMTAALGPDLILLDIAMPGMDGINVARALSDLPDAPVIIFTTAFDGFAVAAFDVHAVDYLMKPIDPIRLHRALDRARVHIATEAGRGNSTRYIEEFWASDINGLTRVRAQDIDRITAERDYMRLHMGKRSWLIDHSLTRLEEELDPERFVRLHRSAIVRKDFIIGLRHDETGWCARLADGAEQRVGRLYAENARKLSGRGRCDR